MENRQMETWQIVALVILGIVLISVVAFFLWKKKTTNKRKATINIDVPAHNSRSIPTIDIPSLNTANQALEKTKSNAAAKVTERHAEAAKIIKEAVSNMADNSQVRQTKNESKLEKLGEELNNL